MAKIVFSAFILALISSQVESQTGGSKIVRAQSSAECRKICSENAGCLTSVFNNYVKSCIIIGKPKQPPVDVTGYCTNSVVDLCLELGQNNMGCIWRGNNLCFNAGDPNTDLGCEDALFPICQVYPNSPRCASHVRTVCHAHCIDPPKN